MTKKKDLVVFLGAGISKPIGIPDMYEFVDKFRNKINKEKKNVKLFNNIIYTNKECPICDYVYKGKKQPPKTCPRCDFELNKIDLEEVISRLHRISQLSGDETYQNILNPGKEDYNIFTDLAELKEDLMDFIYEQCEEFDRLKAEKIINKISVFRKWFGYNGLKIFTTNYDTCVETVFEEKGFATGFKQRGTLLVWNPSTFSETKENIKIYKLHGSITWYKYKGDVIQMPALGRKLDHKKIRFESHILYPLTGKEMFQTPFSELQYQLQKTLETCDMFIVVGYSFRDESIKRIFLNAIHENPELKGIIIDPNISKISYIFMKQLKIIEIIKKIENIDFTEKEFIRELKDDTSLDLQNKAFAVRDLGETDGAIVLGREAIKRALKHNNFKDAAYPAACVSDCYRTLKNNKMARQYSKKSIGYYEKFDKSDSPQSYRNMGILYETLDKTEEANTNYDIALRMYEKAGDLTEIKATEKIINRLKSIKPKPRKKKLIKKKAK